MFDGQLYPQTFDSGHLNRMLSSAIETEGLIRSNHSIKMHANL